MWRVILTDRGSGVSRYSSRSCWNNRVEQFGFCMFQHHQLLIVSTDTVRAGRLSNNLWIPVSLSLSISLSSCPRMSVLSQVLCQVLVVVFTGLGAVVAVWTAKLLARHAWFTYRLSCFSKPHANSWLLGHLGQVGYTHTHTHTHHGW